MINGRLLTAEFCISTGSNALSFITVKSKNTSRQLTGLQFEPRMQNGKPIHEIVGISDEMVRAFSSRRGDISAELDKVKAKFVADNGYEPSEKQLIKLAQQATLATRPAKSEARSLEDLHTEWVAAAHALSDHGVHVPVDHQLAESLKNASAQYEQNTLQAVRQEAYSTPLEGTYRCGSLPSRRGAFDLAAHPY